MTRRLHPLRRAGLAVLVAMLAAAASAAERLLADRVEPAADQHARPVENLSDSDINFRGIFNSDLPGIGRKYQLKLILHPHIGDVTKYDYLRTAIGLRYSLSSHLELSGETNPYFSTGLRDVGFFKESGLVDVRLGFKYRLERDLLPGWDSGFGVSYQIPLGSSPPQLTDGFKHLRSFVSFARTLDDHPNWRVFWKLGADLVTPTDIVGRHEKNDLTDDANSIGAGFIWHRGSQYYTFEAAYETTRLIGTLHDDVFSLRPGIVWEVPRRDGRSGRQWLLGLALTLSDGPDGFDWGLGAKARLDIDFKRMFRRPRVP